MSKIAALVFSLILMACASGPIEEAEQTSEQPETTSSISDVYLIGVSDIIAINVWKNAELSISVPVRPDGKVSLPLIGDVVAAGLSPEELAESITESLKEYLKQPQVSVVVKNPASVEFQRRVRITGAVASPISIPFRDGMTVLDLVLLAGGVTDYANPNFAKLHRNNEGTLAVYEIKLEDILNKGDLETNYPLLPSDIITVPEKSLFGGSE